MLTKRPDIVIALPPKRTRRKAKAAAMPKPPALVLEARDPRRIRRKPGLATRVVDHSTTSMTEDELRRRGEAADRLFQEIKRRAAE